jgi:hypothetical protein
MCPAQESGRARQTHPRVAINPHVLHAARHETRPAPQRVLVTELVRDVCNEDSAGLGEGRVSGRDEVRLADGGVVREFATDEVEGKDCGAQ